MDNTSQQRSAALQSLYDRSARVQSAWSARPVAGHPARSLWDAKFWSDVRALAASVKRLDGSEVLVPPFVLAFLVEHNAAFTLQRPYDLAAMDPARAPRAIGNFRADASYRFEFVDGGWWSDPEFAPVSAPASAHPNIASQPAGPSEASPFVARAGSVLATQSSGRVPALPGNPSTTTAPKSASRQPRAASAAASDTASMEVSPISGTRSSPQAFDRPDTSSGRVTRSASKPAEGTASGRVPAPSTTTPRPSAPADAAAHQQKGAGAPGGPRAVARQKAGSSASPSNPPAVTKKATRKASTAAKNTKAAPTKPGGTPPMPSKTSSPAPQGPGPFPHTFDFNGRDLVDHWVPM
ncbi:hypothetical protein OH76DRAFT_1491012, partial [Lentinus brumalis]